MNNTYRCICAGVIIHPSGQIEQGAQYNTKILDLLDEESISGESSGRASLQI